MKRKLVWGRILILFIFALFLFSGKTAYANVDQSACPWIYGEYSNYNTRKGYVVFDVQNYSNKTITITRDSAKMINSQDKSYDLNVKAIKTYKIKPGKTVRVTFKKKKGTFSGDLTEYTLKFKMKWKNKKYQTKIDFCEMSIWHYDYSLGFGWWEPSGTGWDNARYKAGGQWKSIQYDIYAQ